LSGLRRGGILPPMLAEISGPAAGWTMSEWIEFLSYLVTVVGLPFAIAVFIWEQRRERQNEEEEIFQRLTDEYMDFLKLVLGNADLQMLRRNAVEQELNDEQQERKFALFGILISIFERAYMLVYEDHMDRQTLRLWKSWEDYMREWCRRADFRDALPTLLEGEDEDFQKHISRLAREEAARAAARP
jgi:hypothetical protein